MFLMKVEQIINWMKTKDWGGFRGMGNLAF